MENELKYASPMMRIAAFWIDFLILLSVFYCFGAILWHLIPDSEVPIKGMQLFTPKEFKVYWITALIATLMIVLYHSCVPLLRPRCTLGGSVMKMQIVKPDGSALGWREALRRFLTLVLKCVLIFVIGPIIANYTEAFVPSLLALFLPIGFLIVAALVAQRKPEGAWLWESIGGYRYVCAQ